MAKTIEIEALRKYLKENKEMWVKGDNGLAANREVALGATLALTGVDLLLDFQEVTPMVDENQEEDEEPSPISDEA